MDGDNVAGAIAHDSNERGVAGLRLPMRQVEVRQQISVIGDIKAATTQVGFRGRSNDWPGVIEDEGDLARRVAFRLRGRRRLTDRSAGRPACQVGGMRKQIASRVSGPFLDGAERAAALVAVEIVPVAGMLALERDDAAALLARRRALDVGEPPFIADAAAVREQPRHPGLRRCAQLGDDGIEVVAFQWPGWGVHR